MAVSEHVRTQAASVMVTVNERDKAISLGTLDPNNWDAEKAIAIAGALVSVLENPFSWLRHNPTYQVEED